MYLYTWYSYTWYSNLKFKIILLLNFLKIQYYYYFIIIIIIIFIIYYNIFFLPDYVNSFSLFFC
jgi:hypothetical protein